VVGELETIQSRLQPIREPALLMGDCNRVYISKPTLHGCSEATRPLAICIYVEGRSYSSIGRLLNVNPQSIANWVSQYTPNYPMHPYQQRSKRQNWKRL